MWTALWRWSEKKVDLLLECEAVVRSTEDLVKSGNYLLNQRQCSKLSTQLTETISNVAMLVEKSGASADLFRPALGKLLEHLKEAKLLVSICRGENWGLESVSQILNENAFPEILHDIAGEFCYGEIYRIAKSKRNAWMNDEHLEDLRKSSAYLPAVSDFDVVKDRQELDFLTHCEHIVHITKDLVSEENYLLNKRQCQDLSSKLSGTVRNIRSLAKHFGAFALLFRPTLIVLYRYLEKAKLLVANCAEEDWCAAAVFQIQNENAFREILLDVSLCYNAIYEKAKDMSDNWVDLPQDLRQYGTPSRSLFLPTLDLDVAKDQKELRQRLEDLANDPGSIKLPGHLQPEEVTLKQCLARFLLQKMHCASEHSHATRLDTCSEILWQKDTEPRGTWRTTDMDKEIIEEGSSSGFVCRTKWLGIPCAKKVILPEEYMNLVLKEAGIMAKLKHPSIINFFCCGNGKEFGGRFIAMELMEKSLKDLIESWKDGGFSILVVVDIIVQIACGVCYLHDHGVAHRDLKPQNVVVNRLTNPHDLDHFDVKLVDFGMSKIEVEVSKSNTISHCGFGTWMYRAPEVHPKAGKKRVNWFEADAFSFAMTCAHLLCLETPFQDSVPNDLFLELMNGKRPTLPYDCPKELDALLRDCWSTDPTMRPSFMEICKRLQRFRHDVSRGFIVLNFSLKEETVDFEVH